MRLGAYPCYIHDGTRLHDLYQADRTSERHRHRYEFNNLYRSRFEENKMTIAGTSPDNYLVEAIEYTDHPFYIGVQYHPEFKSRPTRVHPLFDGLIQAAVKNARMKSEEQEQE